MPFPDEISPSGVRVHTYRPAWANEANDLAVRLSGLVLDAVAVEHIGSTSIPGMSAKDCLDMMIVVEDLSATPAASALSDSGYRQRPEPWNTHEPDSGGRLWPKFVFAPPVGGRSVNIHVRVADAPTTRRALLFRDFLRANPAQSQNWARFKIAAAAAADDLSEYGAIKDPAWLLLMELADQWATRGNWSPRWA